MIQNLYHPSVLSYCLLWSKQPKGIINGRTGGHCTIGKDSLGWTQSDKRVFHMSAVFMRRAGEWKVVNRHFLLFFLFTLGTSFQVACREY